MMRNSNMPSPASRTSQTLNWSASWRHLASDPLDMNGKRMNKKRNWRGVSDRVAKDKNEIYQSRKWKELTILKKRANPLCEQCIKDGEAIGIPGGYVKSVECVHHIIPIETARTKEEMRRLAFDWNNLMSLCKSCHARIHKELGSNTAKIVRQRAEARQDRWADNLMSRFVIPKGDDDPTT